MSITICCYHSHTLPQPRPHIMMDSEEWQKCFQQHGTEIDVHMSTCLHVHINANLKNVDRPGWNLAEITCGFNLSRYQNDFVLKPVSQKVYQYLCYQTVKWSLQLLLQICIDVHDEAHVAYDVTNTLTLRQNRKEAILQFTFTWPWIPWCPLQKCSSFWGTTSHTPVTPLWDFRPPSPLTCPLLNNSRPLSSKKLSCRWQSARRICSMCNDMAHPYKRLCPIRRIWSFLVKKCQHKQGSWLLIVLCYSSKTDFSDVILKNVDRPRWNLAEITCGFNLTRNQNDIVFVIPKMYWNSSYIQRISNAVGSKAVNVWVAHFCCETFRMFLTWVESDPKWRYFSVSCTQHTGKVLLQNDSTKWKAYTPRVCFLEVITHHISRTANGEP